MNISEIVFLNSSLLILRSVKWGKTTYYKPYQSLQPTETNKIGAPRELLYIDKSSLQNNLNISVQKKMTAAKFTESLHHSHMNIFPQKSPKAKPPDSVLV